MMVHTHFDCVKTRHYLSFQICALRWFGDKEPVANSFVHQLFFPSYCNNFPGLLKKGFRYLIGDCFSAIFHQFQLTYEQIVQSEPKSLLRRKTPWFLWIPLVVYMINYLHIGCIHPLIQHVV